ncbi:hypothetical protein D9M68_923500 [compost metagenome]
MGADWGLGCDGVTFGAWDGPLGSRTGAGAALTGSAAFRATSLPCPVGALAAATSVTGSTAGAVLLAAGSATEIASLGCGSSAAGWQAAKRPAAVSAVAIRIFIIISKN